MPFYTHYYSKDPEGNVECCAFTAEQAGEYKVELTELGLCEADAIRLVESFNHRGNYCHWYHSLMPFRPWEK